MGKVIYLDEYFAEKARAEMEKECMPMFVNAGFEYVPEPKFVDYPVDISFPMELSREEFEYMKDTNNEIPLWLRRVVNKITRYFYPNAGEDRRFLIWELRKDIYNFFGYNWYSPMDMHPERFVWDF